ncbi:hypothetical protein BU23DRAFT_548564 [Bimuria novae-zelandiae CBS 107.79]|uniref:Uncharacterized protein n=1 Tax=Bimuria novae-zelandiae CBS 107.79 TaxID=1447943 RepID=A0A6A5VU35_9PLEO|nr:hypothetical protein BU23DRAFT_548564 [Bimuria novae-zelandiae CBS 107.79]
MPDKDSENQEHIPVNQEKEEEQEENKGSGGLLSPIGDPPGKALNTGLRPLGAPLEKVTGPLGDALGGGTRGVLGPLLGTKEERSELLGGKNVDSYSKPEKIAGKEQTGDNPLGLDQTGRWGFDDDEEKK